MSAQSNQDFDIKPTADIPYLLRDLDRVTEETSLKIKYIDIIDDIDEAVKELESYDELGCDCEGVRLGRGGKLTLLQLGARDGAIFIFDILKLGAKAFETGLKAILESESIKKIMYDCRGDADSLWQEFQVKLSNVLDMQLLEYVCRKSAGISNQMRGPSKPWHSRTPLVRGIIDTVKTFVELGLLRRKGISNFNDIKDKGVQVMRRERTIWRYRPLSDGLKTYAALDVLIIWEVSEALQKVTPLIGVEKERLEIASERYVGIRRDHDDIKEVFVRTAVLQSYVIPDVAGDNVLPFPSGGSKCDGCKRMMPSVSSNYNGKFCEDCQEIQRASFYRR